MTVSGSVSASAQQDLVTENLENLELPRNVVTSIARSALPPKTHLPADTILALLKGSTAFVTTLAGSAHDVAAAKQHKSVTSNDVFKALETLDLGDLVQIIQPELQAYREQVKASSGRRASASTAGAPISAAGGNSWGVSPSIPSIRIKPPRPLQTEESSDVAAAQWDAHLKMYNRKGKAPMFTSSQESVSAPVLPPSRSDSMDVDGFSEVDSRQPSEA